MKRLYPFAVVSSIIKVFGNFGTVAFNDLSNTPFSSSQNAFSDLCKKFIVSPRKSSPPPAVPKNTRERNPCISPPLPSKKIRSLLNLLVIGFISRGKLLYIIRARSYILLADVSLCATTAYEAFSWQQAHHIPNATQSAVAPCCRDFNIRIRTGILFAIRLSISSITNRCALFNFIFPNEPSFLLIITNASINFRGLKMYGAIAFALFSNSFKFKNTLSAIYPLPN